MYSFNDYQELCLAVKEIDVDAYEYLIGDAKKLDGFNDCEGDCFVNLGNAFVWADSTQGHDYWGEIDHRLGSSFDICEN